MSCKYFVNTDSIFDSKWLELKGGKLKSGSIKVKESEIKEFQFKSRFNELQKMC